MREPGSDGNLNVMFFKNFQIICLMSGSCRKAHTNTQTHTHMLTHGQSDGWTLSLLRLSYAVDNNRQSIHFVSKNAVSLTINFETVLF